jgi:hypothetical protein
MALSHYSGLRVRVMAEEDSEQTMQLADLMTTLKDYGNDNVSISVEGPVIAIDLPNLSTGIAIWRRDGQQLQKVAQHVYHSLVSAGMDVEVRVRGSLIARMGANARPNALSSLLGFSPFEILPLKGLRSLLR